ncbi:MAG: mucoidy inhibitor MuiA family protein [Candidatus Hermodarchaeota archaeon]
METRIDKVTVFRDGARVTRRGATPLKQGPQVVRVRGITELAHEDSFRVKGKGPASLSTIDVRRRREVFDPEEDSRALHEQLKELQLERRRVTDEIETFKDRLSNLTRMMGKFADTFGMLYAANEADIEQLSVMDQKSDKLHEDSRKKLRVLEEKLGEIDDQIQVIRSKIGSIASKRRIASFLDVEISIEGKKEGKVELEITYQVNGARWNPTYDVDLYPGRARLRRIAMVGNQTRENWKRVNLTVSTATARPVEAVDGTPFIISAYDPDMMRRMKAERMAGMRIAKRDKRPAMKAAAALAAPPPPAPPPEIEEEFAEATEAASGISIYEMTKPATIPFDDDRHPVTLIEEEFDSTTVHYWYTDAMAEVVAQDEIENGSTVLLPGKAKVYAEGDYIGESAIDLVSPREKFKLGTRVAYDVKASKNLVEREVEKAGITRSKLKRAYRYRLEIESYSKRAVKVQVFDRVPHSLTPSIEVKIDWDRLNAKEHELGVVEWLFDIEPKQKKEIVYDFVVEWDRDIVITPPLP